MQSSYSNVFGDNNRGLQIGVNKGPIHVQPGNVKGRPKRTTTNIGVYAEPPETPPRPSSTVPFRRDPDFVKRGIFDEIDQRCSVPGSWTALVGLGGVG
jgi:hypothetical protein